MRGSLVSSLLIALLVVSGASTPHVLAGQAAQPAQATPSRAERMRDERDNQELQKIPPFKMFDNLYYVGIGYVGAWLLTTDDGLILIDTLMEPYVDHLIDGVRKVGFDPKDIKYVLVTHAHFDHFGGAAKIQQMFGPKVGMLDADWKFLDSRDPAARGAKPKQNLVFKDGDTVMLGKTTVKLHSFPGHSPGLMAVETTVYDGGKPYKAFIDGAVALGTGENATEVFADNVARLKKISDVEVSLPMHFHGQRDFWPRFDKLMARKPGDPHPFVDPSVFQDWLKDLVARPTRGR